MASITETLEAMAATSRERGKVYGDNYKRIGPVLAALFPDGITLKTADDHNRYHLFLMIMVKVTRLAVTNISHVDSVHDLAVYGAMLESYMSEPLTTGEFEQ